MNVVNVLDKDAIPSIDDPSFADEHIGHADDEVLVLDGERTKAYPVRILNFHEIVNDTVDGDPVAVTWCPLCASAVVYDRTVDGQTLTFGVSGKLADDTLVMYDRETESEWKQSRGECIAGEYEGTALPMRPANVVTYERFAETYPDGVVLQPTTHDSEAASEDDDPVPIDYMDDPYEEYFESNEFGLAGHREGEGRTWGRDDIGPKTVVLGIERDGEAVGYPESRLREAGGAVTDTVGGTDIVVFAADDGLYAFANPGYEFEVDGERVRADGTVWDPITGNSEDGRTLDCVPTQRLYAFTWQDDHGTESFYL